MLDLDSVLIDQDAPHITLNTPDFETSLISANGVRLKDVHFVWNRTKLAPMPRDTDPFEVLEPNEYRVRVNEWRAIVTAITLKYGDSTLNPEISRAWAEQKLLQQNCAASCGFRVLPSIVTTLKSDVDPFVLANEPLVTKALGAPVVVSRSREGENGNMDYSVLATTSLETEALLNAPDSLFDLIPVWLQKKLTEGDELRVIAFGDHVFAYKAPYSFKDRKITDIRFADFYYTPFPESNVDWSPVKKYLKMMRLDYGVFDLCLNEDGILTFLECNPEGMWHSINNTGTENRIFDTFTAHLVAVAEARGRRV